MGAHPHYAEFCRPICCNKCSKMWQIFDLFWAPLSPSHTLWDGHKEVKYCRVNIQTYYEAMDTLRGLFFKIWAKNRFSALKMQGRGGHDKLGKFLCLGQIDLKIA